VAESDATKQVGLYVLHHESQASSRVAI